MGTWGNRGNRNNNNQNDNSNDQGSNNQNNNSNNNNNSRGNSGGYNNNKQNNNNNGGQDAFTFVTNLFESKSGKACTVFLKDDKYGRAIIEVLSSIQIGDMICIRPNDKQGGMSMSIKRGEN